jgi:hypothetical protein
MKILLSYFSRTGCTETLAHAIEKELVSRGHAIEHEIIQPSVHYSCLRELAQDWPRYPLIAAGLVSRAWREHYIKNYHQVEEDIQPLSWPDVSGFDRICIGTPKWAQLSYPVARYLKTVTGLQDKKVGVFATFGGPPLKIFEKEMIFKPMADRVAMRGGNVVATVGISSGYHEAGYMPLFRLASRSLLGQPIENFTLGSDFAAKDILSFCDDLET